MSNTKTISKPKAAPKGKAKAKAAAPLFYAALLTDALAGKFGPIIKAYYEYAAAYHAKRSTVFPRAAYAGVELLKPDDAVAFLEKHKQTSIPNGNWTGRRLYDEMRVQSK
jgi:hypothetical protein